MVLRRCSAPESTGLGSGDALVLSCTTTTSCCFFSSTTSSTGEGRCWGVDESQRPSRTLSLRSSLSLLRFPIDAMARQLLLLLGADAAFAALTDTATFRSITVNGGGAEKPSLFHMVRHSSAL